MRQVAGSARSRQGRIWPIPEWQLTGGGRAKADIVSTHGVGAEKGREQGPLGYVFLVPAARSGYDVRAPLDPAPK
jgi:hypothetical protein